MDRLYTYRFKTKNEFINDFGDYWRDEVDLTWVEAMDWAFGREIENEKRETYGNDFFMLYDLIDRMSKGNNEYFSYYITEYGGFNASYDMITKVSIVPDYKPKKFIRN